MNVIVCVKRVPMTQEVNLKIDASQKEVDKSRLAYVMNEWDSYAAEEAVRIKEKFGGTVTAVTIGAKDDEEVLRRCLAMGADRAIRVEPEQHPLDGFVIAGALAAIIRDIDFDIVLTGVQAEDHNEGVVGSMLSERLGAAHAAVVNRLALDENKSASINMELEGGVEEVLTLKLPAVLSIQSGINEPRYVSIMAVKKARKKEMKVIHLNELNLSEADLARQAIIEAVFMPPETAGAEMIEGSPPEVADLLIQVMKEKGVIE